MRSYLERYLAGEREAVWRELAALGDRGQDPGVLADALDVARETMRRVRTNVETLAARLATEGYAFDDPNEVWVPPRGDVEAQIALIERDSGGRLPLSLRALYEIVGSVNFIGRHDELSPSAGDIYSDPLELAPIDYALSELETWKDERATLGADEVGPFAIPISRDDYHKADVSGGPEYRVLVGAPSAEGRLLHERHGLMLVEYLRLSFAWGGFPGFDRVEGPTLDILERLCSDLLVI